MLKFLLVVALVAVAVYLVVRAAQRGTLRPSRPAPTPRPRQIAPDDDERPGIDGRDPKIPSSEPAARPFRSAAVPPGGAIVAFTKAPNR